MNMLRSGKDFNFIMNMLQSGKDFKWNLFHMENNWKKVNWTHFKLIPSAKGSKDSMHHTYVEVEEGVLLVDPNFLVPPKGEDILLYKTPIFLSPPQRWEMFSYIMWSQSPSFPKRWIFCCIFWGGGIVG
jgi:hypothetical protein